MREIRQSGSEGGGTQFNESFLPLSVRSRRTTVRILRLCCVQPPLTRVLNDVGYASGLPVFQWESRASGTLTLRSLKPIAEGDSMASQELGG